MSISGSELRYALAGTIGFDAAQKPLMMGGQCAQCGVKIFPKPKICSVCWGVEQREAPLATRGKLYSYAVVHAARKGWPSPYAIAYVDLEDGVRICAPLEADLAHLPALDTPVELVVGTLRTDADGVAVLSHRVKPVVEAH